MYYIAISGAVRNIAGNAELRAKVPAMYVAIQAAPGMWLKELGIGY